MFLSAIGIVMGSLLIMLIRLLKGPTIFDRVVAANAVGTVSLILIVLFGFLTARPEFTDIAITYGLLNVISTMAILKFFKQAGLGAAAGEILTKREI